MRSNRNDFLTVKDIVSNGCKTGSFEVNPSHYSNNYEFPYTDYDYCSIMHYGRNYPGCEMTPKRYVSCLIKGYNSRPDIIWKDIGQRWGLSSKDVTAINKRYGCQGYLNL